MASDDFDIVIEAMLEAPYKKEEVIFPPHCWNWVNKKKQLGVIGFNILWILFPYLFLMYSDYS